MWNMVVKLGFLLTIVKGAINQGQKRGDHMRREDTEDKKGTRQEENRGEVRRG